MYKRVIIISVILFILVLITGCVEKTSTPEISSDWKSTELKDVTTGKTFQISDFKGRPILLESFAVWCPTCLQQQKEINKLRSIEGDAIIHISLDTDPNEDEKIVRDHITRNNFDWFFAVSPIEMTRALIDEFGNSVVNAPAAPVVLICEDQSSRLLRRGVKSADELKQEISKGC